MPKFSVLYSQICSMLFLCRSGSWGGYFPTTKIMNAEQFSSQPSILRCQNELNACSLPLSSKWQKKLQARWITYCISSSFFFLSLCIWFSYITDMSWCQCFWRLENLHQSCVVYQNYKVMVYQTIFLFHFCFPFALKALKTHKSIKHCLFAYFMVNVRKTKTSVSWIEESQC